MAPSKPIIHVLAYPFPSSGHIIPMLELAKRLVSRGIYVTVLITPSNLPLVEPLLSSSHYSPFLQSLLLPDPQEKKLFPLVSSMRLLHHPFLLSWCANSPSPSPPLALISDFFLGWTHHLASLLRIPRLVFSPSGASALSFSFSLWQHLPHPNSLIPFPDLPNSPSYPWWQLNHYYRNNHKGDPEWEFHRQNTLDNIASSGIVINTFHHLEPLYLTHLLKTTHHGRVWAVGPVSSQGGSSRGGGPRHEVMTWLDSRPDGSVIYVCFGSRTVLTGRQMEVVTGALEESGAQFVMAIKGPDERHVGQEVGSIPEGFEERMKGRGVVIRGWCPQVDILGHPAVGSFLSHCGWNSVVESLAAGVVMVTWPMGADQYTNARLVVDEVGAGIRGGEGVTENVPEKAELSDVIKRSLQQDCRERVRAREMKRAALEAVEEGGTSHTDLDALLHYFSHLLPHPSS